MTNEPAQGLSRERCIPSAHVICGCQRTRPGREIAIDGWDRRQGRSVSGIDRPGCLGGRRHVIFGWVVHLMGWLREIGRHRARARVQIRVQIKGHVGQAIRVVVERTLRTGVATGRGM